MTDPCWRMDPERFQQACAAVQLHHQRDSGIGALGEKSIHAILKCYFDSNTDTHEQAVGDSVADIVGEHGVIEIQTRQFRRLNDKLLHLLPLCPVTVVYPVIARKRILWIDPDSGELLRTGTMRTFQKPADVFAELYQIRAHVTHPHFALCLAVLEAEDFRLADGFGAGNRRRATKMDRIPTRLLDVQYFGCPADYRVFLPAALPEEFSSAELAPLLHVPKPTAQTALRMLTLLGQTRLAGKQGRSNLYRRTDD